MKKIVFICVIVLTMQTGECPAADFSKVDIHGFISQGYLKSNHNNFLAQTEDGTFEFNDMAINFSTRVSGKLRMGMQFFAKDRGDIGNDDITLDWAYADYQWNQWLGLRVGRIKTPSGFFNENRDIDFLRTCIILPQSVYNENNRETVLLNKGLGIYGKLPMNGCGNLAYQFLVGTNYASKDSGIAKFSEDIGFLKVVDDFDIGTAWIGSMEWETPLNGLRFLVTGKLSETKIYWETTDKLGDLANIPVTNNVDDYYTATLSGLYTIGNLLFVAEYLRDRTKFSIETSNSELQDLVDLFLPSGAEIIQEGYYASVSYRFTDWFETGVYYSVYYRDKDDKKGHTVTPDFKAWLKETCFSQRFDINMNWCIKTEQHIMNGAGIMLDSDNLNENGEVDYHKNWLLFAVKISYCF